MKQAFAGHKEKVNSIDVHPDGRFFASGSDDQTVRIWDMQASETIQTLTGHTDGVIEVKFSPDGQFLTSRQFLTQSRDKTDAKLWDMGIRR